MEKALSGVDKKLYGVEQSLKDVNKLLKLDPTNTELLNQKQKLLQQSISETKNRLETLKQASEQAAKPPEIMMLGKRRILRFKRRL